MSCASELSCCELEAALPTSAPAMGCGASHTDGPRAGWHPQPVRCLLLQWAELLRCSYQQSPASLTDIPPIACFVYSRTFPAMPPVFMLMFSFGDIHLSRKSLSLPQLHLAAVLVAVPHCRVLPRIPSQDGWRLPSIPHLPACSCSVPRLNSHSSESWGQVTGDRLLAARGSSGAQWWGNWVILSPCSSASFLMSLQGQLRGLGRGCWDAAIGRKRHRTSPLLFIWTGCSHKSYLHLFPSSRINWGQPVTCSASFLSSEVELLIVTASRIRLWPWQITSNM